MIDNRVFAGMNGFVWWIGVVENRQDPLKLGRCQIRIFGWHTADKDLIPTADLPWSHPVLPVNNSKAFTTPVEGDWVVGFFFDGPSGQFPAYWGVLPAIPAPYSNNPNTGFTDPRSSAELAVAPGIPAIPTQAIDGSGTQVQNVGAVRNPSTTGMPNIVTVSQNNANNVPQSVAVKAINTTTGISGPKGSSVTVKIAGFAQGFAAALQGKDPDPAALVTTANKLANNIVVTKTDAEGQTTVIKANTATLDSANAAKVQAAMSKGTSIMSALTGTGNSTGQPQSLSGLLDSLGSSSKAKDQSVSDKANASTEKQKADAAAASANAKAIAANSASTSLTDLNSQAGGLAGMFSGLLGGMTPNNNDTNTPVTLDVGNLSSITSSVSKFETNLYKNTPDDKLIYKGNDYIVWGRCNDERLRRGLPSLDAIGYPKPPKDAPANTTTKANAEVGQVAPSPTADKIAPKPIPAKIPLEEVGSRQDDAYTNSLSLWYDLVLKQTQEYEVDCLNAIDKQDATKIILTKSGIIAGWDKRSAAIESAYPDKASATGDFTTPRRGTAIRHLNIAENKMTKRLTEG